MTEEDEKRVKEIVREVLKEEIDEYTRQGFNIIQNPPTCGS